MTSSAQTAARTGPGTEALESLYRLAGKTALVTGAAGGIGQAIAGRLAEAGADLILVDSSGDGLARVREKLAPRGREVSTHTLDLSHKKSIDDLWEGFGKGPPDVLVNNAGIFPGRAFDRVDEAFYRKVFAVNLDAAVWMCQGMIRTRGRRGGAIVNIASIEAILPFKDDLSTYSISKAGVIALTRALAREHARHGFRVNAVLPGAIDTPGTRQVAGEIFKGNVGLLKVGYDFQQRLPVRRMGKPDEVARVVLVLASEMASYMHGAVVPVDGGFLST